MATQVATPLPTTVPFNRNAAMAPPLNTKADVPARAVFVLLDNFSMVSFTGAADVLVTANLTRTRELFKVETCSLNGQKVCSDLGVELAVDRSIYGLDLNNVDLLVVCGGYRTPMRSHEGLRKLLQQCQLEGIWTGGLWNGAFYLADAGVFGDEPFAIHPDSRVLLQEQLPACQLSQKSFTVADRSFSCISPDAAIHATLELLEQLHSRPLKHAVNEILLSNIEHNDLPLRGARGVLPQALIQVIELMENNIEEVLELTEISRYTGMSRRQVERLFNRYLNTSPAKYYLELRLARARQLLTKTNYSVSEIAVASGFSSTTHFSRSFKLHFGVAPSHLRWPSHRNLSA